MNKECEELFVAASAIEQILNSFGIGVDVDIEYTDGSKSTINVYDVLTNHVINYVNSFQPYKFEDLKPNMWVWDDNEKMCCQIINILSFNKLSVDYHYMSILDFEENRFYPLIKANEGFQKGK